MTKDEKLNLAFDALEKTIKDFPVNFQRAKALAAIKAVLEQPELTEKEKISQAMTAEIVAARAVAQPEQEPVAWATYCGNMLYYLSTQAPILDGCHSDIHNKPLYTTPPKRQPLTDEERIEIMERLGITVAGPASDAVDALIKEVEAAHGIKE